ncbi:MAG TPA: cation:proton antiporter [Mariprofundaceae bacterium]|nr:cation:proton antiporter [Mariprofundaceae bacterium]
METDSLVFTVFIIFFGAAVLATLALLARQAMLVSYVVLGILLGPVFDIVPDSYFVNQVAKIGILFLLFLLGLNLPMQKLSAMVRESALLTLVSSLLFVAVGGMIASMFGMNILESLLIGMSLVFSSTIIGLKLLPTTVLHHQRTGEIIISVLLLQDLLAIMVLQFIEVLGQGEMSWIKASFPLFAFPLLVVLAYVLETWLLIPLMRRFDRIKEYIFLLAIGWCLGMAELGEALNLLPEIGAFIAGVVLAKSPISLFIAESLKPLRDFFLIMFFFSVGASFELVTLGEVIIPALVLAGVVLLVKPWIYRYLLLKSGETKERASEVGVRLGQSSEFSLLIAYLATGMGVIGTDAANLIQLATLITFLVSPYLIILRYPTPMAVSDKLRRD